MKSTAIVCAITVASLGFGSLSFAQGFDRRGQGGEWQRVEQPRVEQRGPMHRDYNRDRDGRDFGSRNFDHRDARIEHNLDVIKTADWLINLGHQRRCRTA